MSLSSESVQARKQTAAEIQVWSRCDQGVIQIWLNQIQIGSRPDPGLIWVWSRPDYGRGVVSGSAAVEGCCSALKGLCHEVWWAGGDDRVNEVSLPPSGPTPGPETSRCGVGYKADIDAKPQRNIFVH